MPNAVLRLARTFLGLSLNLSTIFLDKESKLYLHELLAGSEVYVEPLKLPEKVCLDLCSYYAPINVNPIGGGGGGGGGTGGGLEKF